MTRRRLAVLLAAVAVLLASAVPWAGAQSPAEGGVQIIGTDLSDFPTVRLRVAVSGDAAGAPLGADQFTVTENGEAVDAEVSGLSNETVGLVLAIDTSGSMQGDPINLAKAAALQLLEILPDSTRVAVVSFSSAAQLVSAYSTDRALTAERIQALGAQGNTAMYDAVVVATEQTRASDASRTGIVLLSDGGDTASTADLAAATGALADATDDFFVVSLDTTETDTEALAALAAAGEGAVIPATDPAALQSAFLTAGQQIVNQYEVTFTSVTPDQVGTFEIALPAFDVSASTQIALPAREVVTTTTSLAPTTVPQMLTSTGTVSAWSKPWAMWLGAVLIGVAFAVMVTIAAMSGDGRTRERRRSLTADVPVDDDTPALTRILRDVKARTSDLGSRVVERVHAGRMIDGKLDRAGIVMRAGEFVAATAAIAVAAGFVLYLLMGPVGAVIGVLVPVLGANTYLSFKAARRNAAFSDQLGDALLIMAGALRSGFGVSQAIDTVATEMDPPISIEFQRAILESRLGRDMEDALQGVADRVQNEDFAWVIDAMRINRQVGGELATILDQVSQTIRSRNRLKRQVSALTAEGRISALVLGFLPIAIGLVLFTSNPDYMAPLWEETAGFVMLGLAVASLVAGALWLKKLINIEY